MARWTIKNYSIFIRESRERFDLTTAQARMLYNEMRSNLNRPVFFTDLSRHPRITDKFLDSIQQKAPTAKEEAQIMREIEDAIDSDEDFTEFEGAIDYA